MQFVSFATQKHSQRKPKLDYGKNNTSYGSLSDIKYVR
jgi:hypothetical protein